MRAAIDITQLTGKKRKLITQIHDTVALWPPMTELPSILFMNEDQYAMLKRVRNMGQVKEWKYVPADQRVWVTEFNAMDVRIK